MRLDLPRQKPPQIGPHGLGPNPLLKPADGPLQNLLRQRPRFARKLPAVLQIQSPPAIQTTEPRPMPRIERSLRMLVVLQPRAAAQTNMQIG